MFRQPNAAQPSGLDPQQHYAATFSSSLHQDSHLRQASASQPQQLQGPGLMNFQVANPMFTGNHHTGHVNPGSPSAMFQGASPSLPQPQSAASAPMMQGAHHGQQSTFKFPIQDASHGAAAAARMRAQPITSSIMTSNTLTNTVLNNPPSQSSIMMQQQQQQQQQLEHWHWQPEQQQQQQQQQLLHWRQLQHRQILLQQQDLEQQQQQQSILMQQQTQQQSSSVQVTKIAAAASCSGSPRPGIIMPKARGVDVHHGAHPYSYVERQSVATSSQGLGTSTVLRQGGDTGAIMMTAVVVKKRKQRGYWLQFANVERELLAFSLALNLDGYMPTLYQLKKHGRVSLYRNLYLHGGWLAVARRVGLRVKPCQIVDEAMLSGDPKEASSFAESPPQPASEHHDSDSDANDNTVGAAGAGSTNVDSKGPDSSHGAVEERSMASATSTSTLCMRSAAPSRARFKSSHGRPACDIRVDRDRDCATLSGGPDHETLASEPSVTAHGLSRGVTGNVCRSNCSSVCSSTPGTVCQHDGGDRSCSTVPAEPQCTWPTPTSMASKSEHLTESI